MMEKRNVVEVKRTPEPELTRYDDNWDKEAAAEFDIPSDDDNEDDEEQ